MRFRGNRRLSGGERHAIEWIAAPRSKQSIAPGRENFDIHLLDKARSSMPLETKPQASEPFNTVSMKRFFSNSRPKSFTNGPGSSDFQYNCSAQIAFLPPSTSRSNSDMRNFAQPPAHSDSASAKSTRRVDGTDAGTPQAGQGLGGVIFDGTIEGPALRLRKRAS